MSANTSTKVLILYPDSVVAAGLVTTLNTQTDFVLHKLSKQQWHDTDQCSQYQADVVIADYEFGLAFIARQKQAGGLQLQSAARVMILTHRESESEIRYALDKGVRGYLTLNCDLCELFAGVRALQNGLRFFCKEASVHLADSLSRQLLTERETGVLRLLVQGDCNKQIAKKLNIATNTVKSHTASIFQKLGTASRTEAAAVAEKRGLLKLPKESGYPLAHSEMAM